MLGYDPATDTRAIKDRIGVCLQSTNLPDKITVRESLMLFSSFYSQTSDADKLIDRLQLGEKAQRVLFETFRRTEAARGAWRWRW